MKDKKIIAEIGINHKGSVETARELIDIALESNAWGAKFQYRSKEKFYNNVSEIGDEIISEELERTFISYKDIISLTKYGQNHGIKMGVSFFRTTDISDFGEKINCFDFYKIPSAEMMNLKLLDALNKFNKTIFLSTGGHDEKQIKRIIKKHKNANYKNIIYMHCVSNYPIMTGNQQLNFINRLSNYAGSEVGYSSHDIDWEICLIALAMGAVYIERHLTIDKYGSGLDDSTSSDAYEFSKLCKIADKFSKTLGDTKFKPINQGEIINIQNLGTSLYSIKDIKAGEIVCQDNTELRAPRKGLVEEELLQLSSRKAKTSIPIGAPILKEYFNEPSKVLTSKNIAYCDDHSLSLPVRLHDINSLQNLFPIKNFELHLSYGEVEIFKNNQDEFLDYIDFNKVYSIHLPDYLNKNRLIDPLSENIEIKNESRDIINACIKLARILENATGESVPIVGSFSRIGSKDKNSFYKLLAEYIQSIYTNNHIKILPQWLPKIAWYFGGSEILSVFCSSNDVDLIIKNEINICLDISHLILSSNYENADWFNLFEKLSNISEHYHISDATGIDFEGIEFGSGDLTNIEELLQLKKRKVLEVWQGHLDNGFGYRKAIQYLRKNHA